MAKSEKDWRETAKERLKEKLSKGRFKLSEGENTIRILPRVKAKSNVPFFEYLVHREVGPNKRFVRCGHNMHGEGDCWLCDKKIPALQNSGSPAKEKMAAALASKEQFVVQVARIDVDSGKMQGPFLWTVPTGGGKSLSARLLGVLKNTKRDYVDPEKGYNLTIERTGMGKMDTNYGQPIPDEEPSEVPQKILDRAKGFAELIPAYSEEQQKAAYFGHDERAEVEEDDRPKKRPRDEEEETEEPEGEEEADETEESDEDEEEAPVKKGKKKPVEDDEDETEPEESEDDEAEEETSKKKKRSRDEEESEDESEPEGEDEEEPAPKKPKKKVIEEDESEDSGDEDEEEKPVKKGKKKTIEEDGDDEAEEERPRPKHKKSKRHDDDD